MNKAKNVRRFGIAPVTTALLVFCGMAAVNAVKPDDMIATDGKIEIIDGKHIQEITRQFPFEAGRSFKLSNSNGQITVSGWDKNEVLITAEKRLERRVGGVGWVMNKLNIDFKTANDVDEHFDKVAVEVNATDEGVEVDTVRPKGIGNINVNVFYDVKVPHNTNVALKTSNGRIDISALEGTISLDSSNGKVVANDIEGSTEARTSNGSVELVNVSGSVNARTSNGSIAIEHPEALAADESITCETSNGSVRINLPADSAFDIDARTSNGGVRTAFDVDRTDNSTSKRRLSGQVGDGGALVKLTTSNGSISVDAL